MESKSLRNQQHVSVGKKAKTIRRCAFFFFTVMGSYKLMLVIK